GGLPGIEHGRLVVLEPREKQVEKRPALPYTFRWGSCSKPPGTRTPFSLFQPEIALPAWRPPNVCRRGWPGTPSESGTLPRIGGLWPQRGARRPLNVTAS